MNVEPPFKANSQLSEAGNPGMSPFHYPPVLAQPIIALDASPGNARHDAARSDAFPAMGVVIPLIRMQLGRPRLRSAALAPNLLQLPQQWLKGNAVVTVGSRNMDRERRTLCIDYQVAFAAEFAPVGRLTQQPGLWDWMDFVDFGSKALQRPKR